MLQCADERGRAGGHAFQPLHCPGAGGRPFYSKKYDLTRHPQYKYTADANPKYAFDVKAYLEHRLKVKPDEEYELYELGELPPETAG